MRLKYPLAILSSRSAPCRVVRVAGELDTSDEISSAQGAGTLQSAHFLEALSPISLGFLGRKIDAVEKFEKFLESYLKEAT